MASTVVACVNMTALVTNAMVAETKYDGRRPMAWVSHIRLTYPTMAPTFIRITARLTALARTPGVAPWPRSWLIHTGISVVPPHAPIIMARAMTTPTMVRRRYGGWKIAMKVAPARSAPTLARWRSRVASQRAGSGTYLRMNRVINAGAAPAASTHRQPWEPSAMLTPAAMKL